MCQLIFKSTFSVFPGAWVPNPLRFGRKSEKKVRTTQTAAETVPFNSSLHVFEVVAVNVVVQEVVANNVYVVSQEVVANNLAAQEAVLKTSPTSATAQHQLQERRRRSKL